MNILMITRNTSLEDHICSVWTLKGANVSQYSVELNKFDSFTMRDAEKQERLATRIVARDYDFVFSIGFDHEVSSFCQMIGQPYISWVIDLPNYDLFRSSVQNSCNIIFIADSWWTEHLKGLGAKHVFFLPAAAMYLNEPEKINAYDITYIGDVPNPMEGSPFSDKEVDISLLGYLDAMVHSQRVFSGHDILSSAIPRHILEKLEEKYPIVAPGDLIIPKKELYAWMFLISQVDREQRRIDLYSLGNEQNEKNEEAVEEGKKQKIPKFVAFTGQESCDELAQYEIVEKPATDKEYLNIINASRMNVECVSRHYISGASRHAFNVMGQGGVLLINPCEDLKKFFEPEEDYYEYTSGGILFLKSLVLMNDEEKVKKIQKNAREKILEAHTYLHRIDEILKIL